MAKQLQLRRGTTLEHTTTDGGFAGAAGEVTVDTDKETVVVHDGSTVGGFPLARADGGNTITNFRSTGIDDNSNALAMTIDASENIGIGQTTPDSDNSTPRFIHIGDSSDTSAGIVLEESEAKMEIINQAGLQIRSSTSLWFHMRADNGDITLRGTPEITYAQLGIGVGDVNTDYPITVHGKAEKLMTWQCGDNATRRHWAIATDESRVYFQNTTDGLYTLVMDKSGKCAIGTPSPTNIFETNATSGTMLSDGYDLHSSFFKYKRDIEKLTSTNYLEKILNTPIYKYKKKPFVGADEIKQAVLDEFGEDTLIEAILYTADDDIPEGRKVGDVKTEEYHEIRYSVWDEYFPATNKLSHRSKAIYNMPEGELKTWIDNWADAKREERVNLYEWDQEYLGLVFDDSDTEINMKETFRYEENDPKIVKSSTQMSYIAMLHLAIQELSAKVTALENA